MAALTRLADGLLAGERPMVLAAMATALAVVVIVVVASQITRDRLAARAEDERRGTSHDRSD